MKQLAIPAVVVTLAGALAGHRLPGPFLPRVLGALLLVFGEAFFPATRANHACGPEITGPPFPTEGSLIEVHAEKARRYPHRHPRHP